MLESRARAGLRHKSCVQWAWLGTRLPIRRWLLNAIRLIRLIHWLRMIGKWSPMLIMLRRLD